MSRMFRRMSPFSAWLSSWATTPCSSSRERRSTHPRVTPITASPGPKPAANALMPFSASSTNTDGTAMPEARAISSTTFSRRRSLRSCVLGWIGRPPSSRPTVGPPPRRAAILYKVPAAITVKVTAATAAKAGRVHTPE